MIGPGAITEEAVLKISLETQQADQQAQQLKKSMDQLAKEMGLSAAGAKKLEKDLKSLAGAEGMAGAQRAADTLGQTLKKQQQGMAGLQQQVASTTKGWLQMGKGALIAFDQMEGGIKRTVRQARDLLEIFSFVSGQTKEFISGTKEKVAGYIRRGQKGELDWTDYIDPLSWAPAIATSARGGKENQTFEFYTESEEQKVLAEYEQSKKKIAMEREKRRQKAIDLTLDTMDKLAKKSEEIADKVIEDTARDREKALVKAGKTSAERAALRRQVAYESKFQLVSTLAPAPTGRAAELADQGRWDLGLSGRGLGAELPPEPPRYGAEYGYGRLMPEGGRGRGFQANKPLFGQTDAQNNIQALSDALQAQQGVIGTTYGAMQAGLAAAVDAAIMGGESIAKAAARASAGVLRAKAIESAVMALFYAAKATGELFFAPQMAAADFKAAGMYTIAAAAAGAGAAALGALAGGGPTVAAASGAGYSGSASAYAGTHANKAQEGPTTYVFNISGFMGDERKLAEYIDTVLEKGRKTGRVRSEKSTTVHFDT